MKHTLLFILLLSTTLAFSQQEASNWYFGKNAGLKFQPDGTVIPLNDGKLNTSEGCSSISDPPLVRALVNTKLARCLWLVPTNESRQNKLQP